MLSINTAPKGFRILSTTPTLRIKYRSQTSISATIMVGLWCCVMVANILIGLNYFFDILQDIYSGTVINWNDTIIVTVLNYIFLSLFIKFFAGAAYSFLYGLMDTDFIVSEESLTVIKQALDINLKIEIPSHMITEVKQIQVGDSSDIMQDVDTWKLSAITNSKIHDEHISLSSELPNFLEKQLEKLVCFRKQDRRNILLLDSQQPYDCSNWLGKTLEEFYFHIKYYPSFKKAP